MPFDSLGKMLLIVGLVIAITGAGIMLMGRFPSFGSPSGGLSFELGGVKVYVPIVASIVLSIILTVVLNLVFGVFNRR